MDNFIDEKLLLISSSGKQIVGRIEGNTQSRRILICTHGFGVKSDSRGMYTKICDTFKSEYLTVRFHLGTIDTLKNIISISSYSQQVEILKTVLDSVLSTYDCNDLNIISHSQGCYISSLTLLEGKYNVSRLIHLSPIIRKGIFDNQAKKYSQRPGSNIVRDGVSKLVRTDGTTTLVGKEFWDEAEQLDTAKLFKQISETQNTYFIWAKGDTIAKPTEYTNIKSMDFSNFYEIPGDHDFNVDGNIDQLLKLLKTIL